MGIVTKVERAANAVKRGGNTRQQVGAFTSTQKETEEFLRKFPIMMRNKILVKGLRAAAGAVRDDTRKRLRSVGTRGEEPQEHLGRSRRTGTQKKWSKKVRGKRAINRDLHWAMTTKVLRYRDGRVLLAMAGPRHPWGNLMVVHEFGGTIRLWGGKPYKMRARPTFRPAIDATMPEQQKRLVGKLKKEWDKL